MPVETATECGVPTEAELQRACGTLYITHGLESSCGLIMFVFFSCVAIKLHCRGHLRSPVISFLRFFFYHTYLFLDEFVTTLMTVGHMNDMKLEVRLRFCGNLDKMANATSALLSLLGITRWLSIGNVNGMRYIGYALTCPLTQIELVVMLAPIIPCYKMAAFAGFAICSASLSCAYAASLLEMPVWEGDLLKYINSGNIDDWAPTMKFWVVCPGLIGISILWLLILPYYCLMYTCNGGNGNKDLPQEYRLLVSMVWCTWILFPCWWFMSWEGNSIITDTKVNEVGFTVLNMLAKGIFTWQSFRVGELHEARMNGKSGRPGLRSQGTGLSEGFDGHRAPPIVSRASSRMLSKSNFVKVLRSYDIDSSDGSASSSDEEENTRGTGRAMSPQGREEEYARGTGRAASPQGRSAPGSRDHHAQERAEKCDRNRF